MTYSSEASLRGKQERNVDEEILLMLYQVFENGGLPLSNLRNKYRRLYGESAANYLDDTVSKWRSGERRVATDTMSRVVNLIPNAISYNQRLTLIRKLYASHCSEHRSSQTIFLTLGVDEEEAMQRLKHYANVFAQKPHALELPEEVLERMQWVSNQESTLMRQLVAAAEEDYSRMIAEAGQLEIERLIESLRHNSRTDGHHTIEFPYGKICVVVRQPTMTDKFFKLFS
jgi:hypothetical protein